ncbi:MAG: hypothetical protein FJW23_06885 [Acidimicrobiia bacterium]|nr:hypothetical protein [Acidimicrobiia bacterium]
MVRRDAALGLVGMGLALMWTASSAEARQAAPAATTVPPVLVSISGQAVAADGQPRTGSALLAIAIYERHDDVVPMFLEYQVVSLMPGGRYDVSVGATLDGGVPAYVFADGRARWMGVSVEEGAEQARTMFVSVPYAVRAAVADSLTGRSASDFVLVDELRENLWAALRTDELRSALGLSAPLVVPSAAPQAILSTNQLIVGQESSDFPRINFNAQASGQPAEHAYIWNNPDPDSPGDMRTRRLAIGSDTSGGIWIGTNTAAPIVFSPGGIGEAAEKMRITAAGNVGIGVSAPGDRLVVAGSIVGGPGSVSNPGYMFHPKGFYGATGLYAPAPNVIGFVNAGGESARIDASGNLGVGIKTPSARLHVGGDARVTGDMTVDGNLAAKYQDIAEWVDAIEPLDAGMVVTVDPGGANRVAAAARAYDSSVAGAVSAQPGIKLGEPGRGRVLVAQSGRVRVLADARFGAIQPGDLLVTSPTRGHVMRSEPIDVGAQKVHQPGTLVGKALEALPSGRGEILVLLTLQ